MDIFHWRNEPSTRAASRQDQPIREADHLAWFSRALEDPERLILIGMQGETKTGMVRFDHQGTTCEISILIPEALRGQALAKPLLEAALKKARTFYGTTSLLAVIKRSNPVSIRLFESFGFSRASEDDDYIHLIAASPLTNDGMAD